MSIPSLSPAASLAADPRPLPLSAKLLYGVGEMPITVLMVLSGLFMLFFYNSVMGLPSALVGIGLSSSLVVDALLDPYIGHISDRTSHRFGRRHIFMLPGALVMGPCFFLLFSPPRSLGHAGLFVWLLACSIALRAASAVYRIPYLSLGAELSRDYDDRTKHHGPPHAVRTVGHPGGRGAFLSDFLSSHRRWLRTQAALRRISAHGAGLRRVDDDCRPDRHSRHVGLSHFRRR
jgi:hypothetical protein